MGTVHYKLARRLRKYLVVLICVIAFNYTFVATVAFVDKPSNRPFIGHRNVIHSNVIIDDKKTGLPVLIAAHMDTTAGTEYNVSEVHSTTFEFAKYAQLVQDYPGVEPYLQMIGSLWQIGWPVPIVEGAYIHGHIMSIGTGLDDPMHLENYVPIKPIWLPFILTITIETAMVNMLLAALIMNKRRRWRMQGRCITCGYSLVDNESGRCPECGISLIGAD